MVKEYSSCRHCGSTNIIGIEYCMLTPEHYDGVSEWQCHDCEHRVGRFSNQTLKKGEFEKHPNTLTK